MEHIRTILKPLFEIITGEVAVCENTLLNYILIIIIGEIAYRLSYYLVGKAYSSDLIHGRKTGSFLHWIIRLPVYLFAAYLLRGIIAIYDFCKSIPNMITNTTEEFLTMQNWLADNLYWIVPLIITVVFSIINIIMAKKNSDMVKNQIKLQNNAFCYELYEKRMAVYMSLKKLLREPLKETTISDSDIENIFEALEQSRFLFGGDIKKKINNIGELLSELQVVMKKIDHGIQIRDKSTEHIELCNRQDELLKKISKIYEHLAEDFEPYISFENYRIEAEEVKNERSR